MQNTKVINLVLNILFIVISFIFLVKGADLLLKSAISIAKKFGLSEMLIGLTIVAIGTSLPEIFITITSSIDGYSDLITGNAIGSCICNFLLVMGISAIITPVNLDRRIVRTHLTIAIAIMILVLILGNSNEYEITRCQGFILLLFSVIYIVYTVYEERKTKDKKIEKEIIEEVESKEHYSTPAIIVYLILGLFGLKFGSDFVVDNSILVAQMMGLSEKFIGMTIVAVGTALPEIITGIIAARRNETDLLLGNITGSNILNLCLLIGLGAVINPLNTATDFNNSILILIAITVFLQLIAIINKKSSLNKEHGFFLIFLYAIYIFSII